MPICYATPEMLMYPIFYIAMILFFAVIGIRSGMQGATAVWASFIGVSIFWIVLYLLLGAALSFGMLGWLDVPVFGGGCLG